MTGVKLDLVAGQKETRMQQALAREVSGFLKASGHEPESCERGVAQLF